MLTRCPNCATTFRVTPDQLKARQGKVRCGRCQAVFNALETLDEETTVRAPPPPMQPMQPMAAIAATPVAEAAASAIEWSPSGGKSASAPTDESDQSAVAELDAETQPPLEPIPAPVPEPHAEEEPLPEPLPRAEPESLANAEPEPVPEAEPSWRPAPELLLHEDGQPRRRRWPWLLGSLIALCLLTLQAAIHFRTELAVLAPDARPALVAICAVAGCRVGLPHKIDLIGIETSDLIPDKDKPGQLQLVASLRNRAPFVQTWPYLEVTLTDTGDRALLRRALAPSEYLPLQPPATDGFPASGEQAIQLTLQATNIPAVGYRLYVFYP
jgi:predicted Zn finger-like uncharacterized protein